jgi:hypothetical protein
MHKVPTTADSSMRAPPRDPLLATKLYVPPPRPDLVPRPRLIERLEEGCAWARCAVRDSVIDRCIGARVY